MNGLTVAANPCYQERMSKIVCFISLCFLALAPFAAAQETPVPVDTPEAETFTFAERQQQLAELARILGRMHHYHQICRPYDYRPDLFRDRMKELVALEEPVAVTKQKMIEAFNAGFQSAKATHDYCGYEAEEAMRRVSDEGQALTLKIAKPFREIEGYDYYSGAEGTVENGVNVYRGGDNRR